MTDYIVPDEYGTVAAFITQAESDGPGDIRRGRIKTGTYTENLALGTVAWTAAKYLIIESFSGARDVTIDGSGGANTFNLNNQSYLRIAHLIVRDGTTTQILNGPYFALLDDLEITGGTNGYGVHALSRRSILRNSYIHDIGGTSVGVWTNYACRVENCHIDGMGYAGIYSATAWGLEVIGTRITGCLKALRLDTEARVHLRNTTISGCTDGLYFGAAISDYSMYNCIVTGCSNYGILFNVAPQGNQPSCLGSDGNCYYGNTNGHVYDGAAAKTTLAAVRTWTRAETGRATEDVNSIDDDPLEGADGTIANSSPCINAGVSGSLMDGGDYSTDVNRPAIGADGQWDVIHEDPSPPAEQPTLDSVTIDQATGAVTTEWTPGTPGNSPKLYRRLDGVKTWTLADDVNDPPEDDLSELPHGKYYWIVEEFDGALSGLASNAVFSTWAGETLSAYHIERALRQRILGSEAMTDIIGAGESCRLYPEFAPKVDPPYVVFRRISSSSEQEMEAASSWAQARVQFDCYAWTELGALDIAETLRRLFDGWSGTVEDTLEIDRLHCEEISTDLVPPTDGAEEGKYVASVDVLAIYQAVVPT